MNAKITISAVGPNIHSPSQVDYQVKVENFEKVSQDFFITAPVDFLNYEDDKIVLMIVKGNKTASKIISKAINEEDDIILNETMLDTVCISMKLPFLRSKQPWESNESHLDNKFY